MAVLKLVSDVLGTVEMHGGRTVLGRDAKQCDHAVDDRSVSRKHAFVEEREAGWYVVDQGSANGTFLDGAQISEAALQNGQELRLGSAAFRIEIEGAVASTVLMTDQGGFDKTTMLSSPPVFDPPRARPAAAPAPAPARPVAPPPRPAAVPAPAPPREDPQEQALALLGLAPGASAQEVRERHQQVAEDLQTKLAHARNDHLRSTYEKNLRELAAAVELLAPAMPVEAAHEDLPALQPSVGADALGTSRPMRAVSAPEAAAPTAAPGGPSPITLGLAAVVVMLVGITAFFWLSMGKLSKSLTQLEKSSDLASLRADAKRFASTEELEKKGALVNGSLRLCNRSPFPLDVSWLGAVYTEGDAAGGSGTPREYHVSTFNSRSCDLNFHMVLPAGGEATPQFQKCPGDGRSFDGKALVYAIAIKRPDTVEPVWFSGLLGSGGECVKIGEGWTPMPPPTLAAAPLARH